jgi:hypothetical protein
VVLSVAGADEDPRRTTMAERAPHDPTEGEYTDSELPLDAELPDGVDRDLVDRDRDRDRSPSLDVDDTVIVDGVEDVEIDLDPRATR